MSKGGGKGNGLTLEITDGITEHANRVALKGVFSAFGDVLACWVPPIDRRHVDHASVRFAAAESAECAKVACDQGQVFFQGLPLKVKWRAGGGPRVGNSDIGGTVGGNSPTRASIRDRDGGGDKGGGRDRRRRSRSRRRRRSGSRTKALENDFGGGMGGGMDAFNPLADAPMMPPAQFQMPPEMMMQMQQPPMGGMPPGMGGMPPGMGGMGGMQGMPSLQAPEPVPLPPTREEIEAEERRKVEAKARRAAQLKRGPGVAALVQGALKNAQTSTAKNKKEDDVFEIEKEEPKKEKKPEKSKAQIEAERQQKEEEEAKERARLEREAIEREKEKARQKAIELAKEEERLKAEAEEREARVKQGVQAAKQQQAMRENRAGGKAMGPANLYGDMPDAGNEPEEDAAEKRRKEELRRQKQNFNLPPEDPSKVVFLDIDGVLRPARAGGFDILSDGKETAQPDTSDFFPSAMKALRHIMERTGAILVLSSEWRRSEALRDSIDEVLEANRIRPSYDWTSVAIEETKNSDPVRSFADRRAREVSDWLGKREAQDSVKGWVVLDDINLAIADEDKKGTAKSMAPKLVQTWPLCGLTMGNAKTAVRILNGEMIHKVLVERPKAPGGINVGAGGAPGRV